MRIRLPWKENVALAWRASSAGTSVSTVTFELGTIIPMRWWLTSASRRAVMSAAMAFLSSFPTFVRGRASRSSTRSGHLNFATSRAREVVAQVLEGDGRAVGGEVGAAAFPEPRVGHRDEGGLDDVRVGEQQQLDLLGVDLLAAAVDEVLDAALDRERADARRSWSTFARSPVR